MNDRYDAVIIGAGPAGLSAANELVRRGARPLVLEKGDKVGGLARTENYKGNRFDIGGHRFYTEDARIKRLWQEMLGADFLTVKRLSRIYYNGRFFQYPLNVSNALSNLGVVESSLMFASYLKAKTTPWKRAETFEEWVSQRFGRRLYKTFFEAYTEKVWGLPCKSIRADWAAERIGGLSMAKALQSAIFGTNGERTLVSEFNYPLLGPGMMWERFSEQIEKGGGRVWLGAEAVRFRHEDGRVRTVTARTEGGEFEIETERVISTMPLAELAADMEPAAGVEVRRAAEGLRYRAFVLVGLVVDREDIFRDNWIYIHSPQVRVGRIQNFGNWSRAMVAGAGKSSVGMEYFCDEGDGLWTAGDGELVERAAAELEALGLARRAEVSDGVVIRQPKAYPVYDEGYQSNVAAIRRFLSGIGNLECVGRNGMHRYNNQDHSMLAGILAARNVLGEKHDPWTGSARGNYLEDAANVSTRGAGASREF